MPIRKYEHLEIPFSEQQYERKKRSGSIKIVYKKEEQQQHDETYSDARIEELSLIQNEYKKNKKKYEEFLDPKLIFKIDVDHNIFIDGFRNELNRMNINVLSESPDNSGYWIVFADDEELTQFKKKVMVHGENETRYKFFYAINKLIDIPPEEKIGPGLNENPLIADEKPYLDVEIWRMDDENLNSFLPGFKSLIDNQGGKISDHLITKNFCLLRVRLDQNLINNIANLKEIALIDRPPYYKTIEEQLQSDIEDFDIKGNPPEKNTGILIIDSGIRSGHPLLSNAVADEAAIATYRTDGVRADDPTDDVGHGTMVSGVALYGDVGKCIRDRTFQPEIWIFSSKVMYRDEYGQCAYDPKELFEHQLEKAVRRFVTQYDNCKIINLSLGNNKRRFKVGMRQFNLAALIDELSKELNVVFVISAGNSDRRLFDNYLQNFFDNSNEQVKIIEPATSALGLTVGASCFSQDMLINNQVISPFTRVGPGLRGMIKPELIDNGGGGFSNEKDIISLNYNWINEGRLFTRNFGTSLSTPKISHILAKLMNKFNNYSPNLIKAILISSSSVYKSIEETINGIDTDEFDDILDSIMMTGYGIPDLEYALYSFDNRVVLLKENELGLNKAHIYPIDIPESFIREKGKRSISVSLAFDPPVNKNRADYLGCVFEIRLYKNIPIEEIEEYYRTINIGEEDEEIMNEFKKRLTANMIGLKPNLTTRKLGVHQKGIIKYIRTPTSIDTTLPLVMVIINRNRWIKEEEYMQNYGVVVTIEHQATISLYNDIRVRMRNRLDRLRIRP